MQRTVFSAQDLKINVVSAVDGAPFVGTKWISAQPSMPALQLHIGDGGHNVNPELQQVGPLVWRSWISYTRNGRNDSTPVVSGQSDTLAWTINFGSTIQGGILALAIEPLSVRSLTDGTTGTMTFDVMTANVLGTNPSPDVISSALGSLALQVIAYKESRFRQFDTSGNPLFGPPRGFGVMQIDTPPATAAQVWDWRANVQAGIDLYSVKVQELGRHYQQVRSSNSAAPPLSAEQLQLAIYQYYNGGCYWMWDAATRIWTKTENTAYGDDAMRIQHLLASGHQPVGWVQPG